MLERIGAQEAGLYASLLGVMFPPDVIVDVATPDDWYKKLSPAQEALIEGAVLKRKAEFRAGRNCAQRALINLLKVQSYITIGVGEGRSPEWPLHVVGSISHTNSLCVSAVGHKKTYLGLGVDIEPCEPLKEDLLDYICTPQEQSRITDLIQAKYLFCVKESFFKVYWPIKNQYLDFLEAEFTCEIKDMIRIDGYELKLFEFKLNKLKDDFDQFVSSRIYLVATEKFIFCSAMLYA